MSNHNVKPGDRAIVVKAHHTENLGMVVDVLRAHVPGETLPGHPCPTQRGNRHAWVIESCGQPFRCSLLLAKVPFRAAVQVAFDDQLRRLEPPEEDLAGLSAPVEDSQTVSEGVEA